MRTLPSVSFGSCDRELGEASILFTSYIRLVNFEIGGCMQHFEVAEMCLVTCVLRYISEYNGSLQ